MVVGRIVSLATDPLALARGLVARGHRDVALLHAADRAHPGWPATYLGADPDDVVEALDPLRGDAATRLVSQGNPLARAPRWIGVLPYEARRDLERPGWRPEDTRPPALLEKPCWRRYPAIACFDPGSGSATVIGESHAAASAFAEALHRADSSVKQGDLRFTVDDDEPPLRHAERVGAARELILAGDLYQVNLARRLRVRLEEGTPLDLYERLARAAHPPFGACLHMGDRAALSTSPELLLSASPSADGRGFDRLATEPIKGTRPRGAHAAADEAMARELDADPKERAELSMIVDVERNDLGRVARTASVRLLALPHVVTHRTIHHRVARLIALARPDLTREDVLRAMVPSGSVTGAPKVRAMEVIASLESKRRGLYTGGLGFVAYDGGVTLAMAIRTVVLQGSEGEYFTGGGIVADSDPLRELEETQWKALQLRSL